MEMHHEDSEAEALEAGAQLQSKALRRTSAENDAGPRPRTAGAGGGGGGGSYTPSAEDEEKAGARRAGRRGEAGLADVALAHVSAIKQRDLGFFFAGIALCLLVVAPLQPTCPQPKPWTFAEPGDAPPPVPAPPPPPPARFDQPSFVDSFFSSQAQNAAPRLAGRYPMPPPSSGGLDDNERKFLIKYMLKTRRMLEWGMGESTKIAAAVGVKSMRSIDSHPDFVKDVKAVVPPDFDIVHVDIGPVKDWGVPVGWGEAGGSAYQHLWPRYADAGVEGQAPFDTYFVDGRFRVACVCTALLHGGGGGRTPQDFVVLLHDFGYHDRGYDVLLQVADVVDGSAPYSREAMRLNNLAVFRRKSEVGNGQIEALKERLNVDSTGDEVCVSSSSERVPQTCLGNVLGLAPESATRILQIQPC